MITRALVPVLMLMATAWLQAPSPAARDHFNRGRQLFEAGRLVEAKQALEAAISEAPRWPDAWYLLGNVFLRGERWSRAAEHLRLGLDAAGPAPEAPAPIHAKLRYALGISLLRAGSPEAAASELRQSLKLDPSRNAPRVELGALLARHGDDAALDEAIGLLRSAAEHDDRSPRAHYELGLALSRREDHESAATSYEHVLDLDPDHLQARYNLGRTLMRLGRAEEGQAVLADYTAREAQARAQKLALRGAKKARQLFERARLTLADGDTAEALQLLERAAELAPEEMAIRQALEKIREESPRD